MKIPQQLVHTLGGKTLSILALIVACFIVLAGFWYQQQTLVARGEAQISKLQVGLVDSTFTNISDVAKNLSQKVSSAAGEAEMVSVFESGHGMVVDLQQTLLKKTIPEALAICLLTLDVDALDPDGCVPINYVVLDLLRQAKTQAKVTPFAMTELADKQRALVITHQVANTAGEVVGVLLIAFEPTEILSLLPKLSESDGFITIQQGKSKKTALAFSGDMQWRQGEPSINRHVAGSYWDLSYWPAEYNSERAFWGLVSMVLLGLILLWLWREFWQSLMLRQDMATVTKQIGDWKRDALQLDYPVGSAPAKRLVKLIAGLGPIAGVDKQITLASLRARNEQTTEHQARPNEEMIDVEISETPVAPEQIEALNETLAQTDVPEPESMQSEPLNELHSGALQTIEVSEIEPDILLPEIEPEKAEIEPEKKKNAAPETIEFKLTPKE